MHVSEEEGTQQGFFLPLQWHHNARDGVSNHQRLHCLLNCWFRRRSKKTSKLRVTGLCDGNSTVPGEFPAQKASNAENVFISWRHNVCVTASRCALWYECIWFHRQSNNTTSLMAHFGVKYYSDVTWASWRLKSPYFDSSFNNSFMLTPMEKGRHYCPFVRGIHR